MKKIYMIGNTHFDPVWLWTWDEAMSSVHATFRSALDRMKEDEDFIYSFATPPVFEWIREIDPAMFEEIRERVKEGRWELCEGWWLQPDCFSGCGESYARQSLYGQRYLMEHFGQYAETVFNIDSFGHNAATPQILRKSGMKYYCFCRPEKRHVTLDSPYFTWVGNDGSEVKAFRAGQISGVYNKDMRKTVATAEENFKAVDCNEMMVYGVTDHGGAPTKQAIADIHALAAEKDYEIKFSTVKGYFEESGEPSARYTGELITGDFGVYTDNHEIKRRNRVAEYALLNAEKAALIAENVLGRPYPKDKIGAAWRDVMFNQFHDILGGASIKDAYFDAYNGQGRAILGAQEITHFALQSITKKTKSLGVNPTNPWSVVVWNLNETPYEGYIEAELQWLHEFPLYNGGIVLEDETGRAYECQIVLEKSVVKAFRSRVLFKATIPAMGYRTFRVVQTGGEETLIKSDAWQTIDTRCISVTYDPQTGRISQLTHKKTGKTLANLVELVCLADEGDTWCFAVSSYGERLGEFTLDEARVVESGAHRTVVKAVYRFRDSIVTLYYTFYSEEDYFDLRYVVNWNEKHAVLKLALNVGKTSLRVASPYGSESRAYTDFDVPMGEWLCAHGEDFSVGVLADSLFSYTYDETGVALSILRSCIYGDLRIADLDPLADYPFMEQGITEGRLRILLGDRTPTLGKIASMARAFNNPPIVICDTNHEGTLAPTGGFMRVEGGTVTLGAAKKAEDDGALIVRLNEYAGEAQRVTLRVFDRSFALDMAPFEIKTLRIEGDSIAETSILEHDLG